MPYKAVNYREQLKALLPSGEAFPQHRGSNLDKVIDAMSVEFSRVDGRADQLSVDAIPNTTAEMLTDWERVAGLPDNCSGLLPETVQARRNDLVSKLTSRGGQSRDYFIAMAAALGYTITIEEFRPFRAGESLAGDRLTNDDWVYTWRIRGPEITVNYFRAGLSSAGEPLAYWGNQALECRMAKTKPAHTILIFAYGDSYLYMVNGSIIELIGSGNLQLVEGF